MKAKYLFIFIFCILGKLNFAQDGHFSQFNATPLNINPALTGLFNSDIRLSANYRSQWSSVTTPFLTYSAAIDMNLHPDHFKKDFIGVGLLVNADRAGNGDFSVLQISPCLGYTRALNENTLYLSYAMQVGMIQQHFNPNLLSFDKQYNGDNYDANLGNGEAFASATATALDASMGINTQYQPRNDLYINTGIALYHFNRPGFAFTNGSLTQIAPRITFHTNASIRFSHGIDLLPGLLYMQQAGSSQYTLGSLVKLNPESRKIWNKQLFAVYGGLWCRLKNFDAVIVSLRLDYDQLSIAASYDINTSKLAAISNAQGGPEFSLTYLMKKPGPRHKKIKYQECPVLFF